MSLHDHLRGDEHVRIIVETPANLNNAQRRLLEEFAKASGEAGKSTIAKLSREKLREIAKTKMEDLNTSDPAMALRIVEGTARSMGIEVVD